MKKSIFVILSLLIIAMFLVGCAPASNFAGEATKQSITKTTEMPTQTSTTETLVRGERKTIVECPPAVSKRGFDTPANNFFLHESFEGWETMMDDSEYYNYAAECRSSENTMRCYYGQEVFNYHEIEPVIGYANAGEMIKDCLDAMPIEDGRVGCYCTS